MEGGSRGSKVQMHRVWGFEGRRRRNDMENISLTTWLVMMMCIREKKWLSLEKACLCRNGQKVMGILRGELTNHSGLPGKFQFILVVPEYF